jgi:SAM-dependent methyltransferase
VYVKNYIRPREGDKILDMGCGTADILAYLPSVEYVGLDMNEAYINYAKKRFRHKGIFLATKVDGKTITKFFLHDFDIVLATGLLHHLNDDDALRLFELANSTLKPGGRLITLDGCYVKGQSWLASLIMSKDRGKYVRTKDRYLSLSSEVFTNIQVSVHHDLIRIPYTHIIMECTA